MPDTTGARVTKSTVVQHTSDLFGRYGAINAIEDRKVPACWPECPLAHHFSTSIDSRRRSRRPGG